MSLAMSRFTLLPLILFSLLFISACVPARHAQHSSWLNDVPTLFPPAASTENIKYTLGNKVQTTQ